MAREKVFVGYSHRDRLWLERLREHLAVLERWDVVRLWSDTRIASGARWQAEMDAALRESKVAVLVLSPAFLASRYIWEREIPAIRAHAEDGMDVVPLVARPCAWRLDPELVRWQARPSEGRALSMGSEAQIDLDLSAFVYDIAALIDRFSGSEAGRERERAEDFREAGWDVAPEADPGWTRAVPLSWTGLYEPSTPMTVSVSGWDGSDFVGTIDYVGTGTRTRIEGARVEGEPEVTAVRKELSDLGPGGQEFQALRFAEVAVLESGSLSVSLDGEYRALMSPDLLVGAWFQGPRRSGVLRLSGDN